MTNITNTLFPFFRSVRCFLQAVNRVFFHTFGIARVHSLFVFYLSSFPLTPRPFDGLQEDTIAALSLRLGFPLHLLFSSPRFPKLSKLYHHPICARTFPVGK